MIIKDFIEESKKWNDVEVFVKKYIVHRYVPYEQKILICSEIVKQTSEPEINTPARFFHLTMELIKQYTNLDVNPDTKLSDFNLLEENNLTGLIIGSIPTEEYERFDTILKMLESDYYENNKTIQKIIEGKIDAISKLMENMDLQEEDIDEN